MKEERKEEERRRKMDVEVSRRRERYLHMPQGISQVRKRELATYLEMIILFSWQY